MNLVAQDVGTFSALLDKHGWPAVIVLLLVVAAVVVARWFAPRLDGLFTTHRQFVDGIGAQQAKILQTQESLASCQEEINANQVRMLTIIEQSGNQWKCRDQKAIA